MSNLRCPFFILYLRGGTLIDWFLVNAFCIFTGRNEVVTKVIFLHLSVILLTGGGGGGVCLNACWDTTPPRADTPWKQTPPRSRHPPWNRPPLGADTPPEQTSPGSRHTPQEQTPPPLELTPPPLQAHTQGGN